MRGLPMDRVTTQALIENLGDLYAAKSGTLPKDQVRRLDLADVLVDTGATSLSLPKRMIHALGLELVSTRRVLTSAGPREAGMYGAVRLTIMGRDCPLDVVELPDEVPPLIGQIPLGQLDFVVDPRGGKLIGNPAHGGEHVMELY